MVFCLGTQHNDPARVGTWTFGSVVKLQPLVHGSLAGSKILFVLFFYTKEKETFPKFPNSIIFSTLCKENYKYGYEALLPETRKTSRLRFPLIESLKIDEVNYD